MSCLILEHALYHPSFDSFDDFLIIHRSFTIILDYVALLIWLALLWCFNMGFSYLGRHLVPKLFWDIGSIMFPLFLISSIVVISISGATTIPARLIGPNENGHSIQTRRNKRSIYEKAKNEKAKIWELYVWMTKHIFGTSLSHNFLELCHTRVRKTKLLEVD